jgi:NAD dependent epimerase/dehydratase
MTHWSGTRVLVTGAGGFIGSHLTERLVALGAQVTALVHYDARPDRGNLECLPAAALARLTLASGDLCDPFFMQEVVKGQEVVFHLGALIPIPYSYRAPASYLMTNAQGTLNVCEACRRGGVRRLVHTSTSETYGTALRTPIDEEHPLQAQSPYAASKIAADKLVESYHRSFGLPAATIRPFNTYGPRQSARAVIPTVMAQLVSGAAALRVGSLAPARDFLFVEDTVEGFLAVASSDACVGTVTNVGTGVAVTIGEMCELAMQVTGRRVEIVTDDQRTRPEKSEVMNLLCDARAAERRCGWRPRVTLRDGLEKVAAFIRANPQRFRPEEYVV